MDFLLFNGVELSLKLCQGNSAKVKEVITIKALIQGWDHFTIFLFFPDN